MSRFSELFTTSGIGFLIGVELAKMKIPTWVLIIVVILFVLIIAVLSFI